MSNNHPANGLVNVFIASYNRKDYLRLAIESVLSQTYNDFHIYIVDDASNDGTTEFVKEIAAEYPDKITAICKKENKGVGDSVNIAMEKSKSAEFFAFHADDDVWEPEKLELQVNVMRENPKVGLVHANARIINGDGDSSGVDFKQIYGFECKFIPGRIFLKGNFLCGSTVLVRADCFSLFNYMLPPRVNFFSDCFSWIVISSAYDVAYIDECLVRYRVSSVSVQKTMPDRMREEVYFSRKSAYIYSRHVRKIINYGESRRRLCHLAMDVSRNYKRQRKFLKASVWFFRALLDRLFLHGCRFLKFC